MSVKKTIQNTITFESEAEQRLMGIACDICERLSVDAEQVEQMLCEAVEQYKASEYGLLEKTIDSLARLVGLTTQPTDREKLGDFGKASEAEAVELMKKLDREVRNLVAQGERTRIERDQARREADRLSGELNAANEQLAKSITRQNDQEKNLIANIQLMVAEKGRDWVPTDEDAVGRIMNEFGLEADWDAQARGDRFTRFIVSDPGVAGIKHPAILKHGRPVRNGVVYAVEAPPEGDSQKNEQPPAGGD